MIALVLIVGALSVLPYEPHVDCRDLHSLHSFNGVVDIEITNGADIRWDYQLISRVQFESYLNQERERAKKTGERDAFRVYRDAAGIKEANDIVAELNKSNFPFAKNCFPIP
jgi:hypothetical protein